MTIRQQLYEYFQTWTAERMHHHLHIESPNPEEQDTCFLCNGFASKMDMLQNAAPFIFHSTMMDIHYGGGLRDQFQDNTFELYFNAREPEYTDAQGLAQALDRAKAMMDGFIKDITAKHRLSKQNHTQDIFFFMDVDNLRWDSAGPFGDGWESFVLYINITAPFNYC